MGKCGGGEIGGSVGIILSQGTMKDEVLGRERRTGREIILSYCKL